MFLAAEKHLKERQWLSRPKKLGKPKNTGVGSLSLLQGDLPDSGIKPGCPVLQVITYQLSYQGSPSTTFWKGCVFFRLLPLIYVLFWFLRMDESYKCLIFKNYQSSIKISLAPIITMTTTCFSDFLLLWWYKWEFLL